jgi:hypothetical protein
MTTHETDRPSDEITDVDDKEVLAGADQEDDVSGGEGDDESVLLTENVPGSVLPPEYEAIVEPQTTDIDDGAESSPIERLEPVGPNTPVDSGAGSYQERWNAIPTGFIDDPPRAAEGASSLLTEMWEAIERSIADERQALDRPWQNSERSTDELRAAMQDYRDLYSRLTNITSS